MPESLIDNSGELYPEVVVFDSEILIVDFLLVGERFVRGFSGALLMMILV
jgi:hypothetical protein